MSQFGAKKAKNTDEVRAERAKPTPVLWGLGCAIATIGVVVIGVSNPAYALPSFARQTGQPCGACHTDFPGLTPFGRQFKLGGYTLGGGDYPLTPFESSAGPEAKALSSYARKMNDKSAGMPTKAPPLGTPPAAGTPADIGYNGWMPPIAVMGIFQFTHQNADRDPADVEPWNTNDNVKLNQASVFYGGAVTEHTGAFVQWTYEPNIGAPDHQDPYGGKEWHWDNVDLRAANAGQIGGVDVTYGLTATNNPSMADPWNTTPVWGFPYTDAGDIATSPAAATMLDGGSWGQQVGGVGGYAWFDNLVYVQLSGFGTLDPGILDVVGITPFDAPGKINGVAPYWRVAVEPHWGNNWWEFGTFGMTASFSPYTCAVDNTTCALDSAGMYTTETSAQSNRYTDVGFDSQYQYQGDNYWITARATFIHENQSFDLMTGTSANTSNTLNNLKLYGSFAYGNDNRIVFSGQYFDTWGSSDATEYGTANGSPNTNGVTLELSYIPFILSKAPVWPWANARVGAQYTIYNEFDGTNAGASDNNTFNLYLWLAG